MRILKNKIVITGATSGIGKALLEKFLALDNQVIAVGRNKNTLEQLTKTDSRIIPYVCDVSNREALQQLANYIEKEHQDLNLLINNAGMQYNYSFENEPQLLDEIEYEHNVNLLAPLRLIALLLPTLQKNENSAIVNISSALALVPKSQAPVYCGTKAAIHIFSKSLRYQLKKVKVFEIVPPLVDTKMTEGRGKDKITPQQLVEEFLKAFEKNKYEVNIGKVKLLRWIHRLSPALADRIMKGAS